MTLGTLREDAKLKYKNPNYRKIKGSHVLIVSCGYCKTDIARYQKIGRGNLLRLHIDRMIESSVDFSKNHGTLLCPNCHEQLATKANLKGEKKEVYKMIRGAFNTRKDKYRKDKY